jgi:uncharacterized protein
MIQSKIGFVLFVEITQVALRNLRNHMQNPFTYWHVVGEGSFCNRKKELAELTSIMEQGGRAFLYAERRVGKTSLVQLALSKLPRKKYIPVYIDLWTIDSEESFITSVAKAVSASLDTSIDKAVRSAAQIFTHLRPTVGLSEQGLPQFSFELTKSGKHEQELEDVLNAPERIAEKGRSVVIVFDEFQQIASIPGDAIERKLRSIIQHQRRVSYVFMGSRKHMIQEMFLKGSKPLYRSATQIHLGPIHEQDWQPFIAKRFEQAQKNISTQQIQSLVEATQGHPFYSQYLSHVLWDLCPAGSSVTDNMLHEALEIVLQREDYAYGMLWQSLTRGQQKLLKALAVEGPGAKPYASMFLEKHRLGSASSVQRNIRALLDKDVIDQEASSFIIVDRFFGFWLKRLNH